MKLIIETQPIASADAYDLLYVPKTNWLFRIPKEELGFVMQDSGHEKVVSVKVDNPAEQKGLRWVRATPENLPESDKPELLIVRWFDLGRYLRVNTMTANQIRDRVKVFHRDLESLEYLCDESTPSEPKEGERIYTEKDFTDKLDEYKKMVDATDIRFEERDIALEKVWMKFIEDWKPGQVNSGLGEALQKLFEKEGEKEAFAIGFVEWMAKNWWQSTSLPHQPIQYFEQSILDKDGEGNDLVIISEEFTAEELITLYKSTLEKEGKKP